MRHGNTKTRIHGRMRGTGSRCETVEGVRLEVSKSGQLSARDSTANNSFPAFKSDTSHPGLSSLSLCISTSGPCVSRYHVHQGDHIIDIITLVIFLLTEGSNINGNIQRSLSKYHECIRHRIKRTCLALLSSELKVFFD